MDKRPIIGITMGDPAGGGPELTAKVLSDDALYNQCRPVVIGDAKILADAIRILHSSHNLHIIRNVKDSLFRPGTIDIYDMNLIDIDRFAYGKVSAMCGDAAFKYVVKVIDLAMKGEVDATVTNALNKEAMNLAGYHFSGHTEIYARYTDTKSYCMMLVDEDFRVAHVSTHVSLRLACDLVKKARILEVVRLADKACRQMGIAAPKVGVCGLNPHAGENGLFGTEEIDEISPAIDQAKEEGIDAIGPLPPDTAFSKARGGWYDIVVAMYHDQGHIPLKVTRFIYNKKAEKWDAVRGVNITLGLPIIRASVDHGTAFDIAGSGKQNPLSLQNAIQYAITMANNRES